MSADKLQACGLTIWTVPCFLPYNSDCKYGVWLSLFIRVFAFNTLPHTLSSGCKPFYVGHMSHSSWISTMTIIFIIREKAKRLSNKFTRYNITWRPLWVTRILIPDLALLREFPNQQAPESVLKASTWKIIQSTFRPTNRPCVIM